MLTVLLVIAAVLLLFAIFGGLLIDAFLWLVLIGAVIALVIALASRGRGRKAV